MAIANLVGEVQDSSVLANSRRIRAEYCTQCLEDFELRFVKWAEIAEILIEVERDQLYLEVGCKSPDEWLRLKAPKSYRLCYAIKSRWKALKPYFTVEELKAIPPETAQWASRAKNISPATLSLPEVKEALKLPKSKAVEVLRKSLPDQHIEDIKTVPCKFAVSQYDFIYNDAYEAFKYFKDETASFEEFIEFCASEFMHMPSPDGGSFMDQWEEVKQYRIAAEK